MKQTFTLIAALFIALFASAQQAKSKLSISIAANVTTRIQVDNIKYKMDGDELVLNNVVPGNHNVKIYQLKSRRNFQQGQSSTTSSYQLVYNGTINLKPQTQVDIMINRFGKALTDEQAIGRDDDQEWTDIDNWNDNNGGAYNNGGNYNNGERTAMTAASFAEFKKAIMSEYASDTKEKMAKQYIATNYFTSAQVKELLQLFIFESNKVEVAKFAYKNTIDKGNYFTIYSAFIYSSSKDEIAEYIRKNP